jgi:hypothetical protein
MALDAERELTQSTAGIDEWRSEGRLALRAGEAHGVKPPLSLYPMPPIFINRRHGFSLG